MTPDRLKRRKAEAMCNVTPEAAGISKCDSCRKKLPPKGNVYWVRTDGESGDAYVGDCCIEKLL